MAIQATRRRKTAIAADIASAAPIHDHDRDWSEFMHNVQANYHRVSQPGAASVLFETDAADLYRTFLFHLPAERLVHTCSACRRFVETYGGLVTITPGGTTQPLFWDPAAVPEFYRISVAAVAGYVSRAKVMGVFLSKDATWGLPKTGAWTHLSVERPGEHVYRHMVLTPGQAMAEKREDYGTVQRALAEFGPAPLKEALRILEADAVNRAEKFVGPVKWLLDLQWTQAAPGASRDRRLRENRVWRAVASAPAGFCHPRSSVIGSLLEDIAANKSFEEVRASFNAKVHGLRYQRPQAAPAAGNVLQAEKLVEKLGIARSLERRFARLEELETIWRPAINWRDTLLPGLNKVETGRVFSHLKTKTEAPPAPGVTLPRQVMTWEKFRRMVLPTAQKMELLVPHQGTFCAFVTAAHADAPNILKWDNPVSQYVYHHEPAKGHVAPDAASWGLKAHTWCAVTGVALRANMWGEHPKPHLGEGVAFILQGAKDSGTNQGNALFPEILMVDLHSVYRTIAEYSKNAVLSGREEASACGLAIGNGSTGQPIFRVTVDGRSSEYQLDRWD